MTALRHLRSDTANKRPDPVSLNSGQLAINYEASSPGLFFKDTNGNLVKAGPVHIGTSAPNATPAAGGSSGNAVGEFWLDTTGGAYDLKVWSGAAWVSTAGEYVNITGDTMTGDLKLDNANLVFEGATIDSFETTLTVVDPTTNNTITLPNVSGTVVTTGDTGTVTSTMLANATIVDANISASAEIAVSKLADGTARQLLQTDAAGTGVEWTSNVDVPGTLDVTGAATFDSTASVTGDLAVNTSTLFVDASANAVGIGTTTPSDIFTVKQTVNGGNRVTLYNDDNTPLSGAQTNIISFDFSRTGSSTLQRAGAVILAGKEQEWTSTAGTQDAYLAFYTTSSASATERLRVDSSGRLLVGTTTPSSTDFGIEAYKSSGRSIIAAVSNTLANSEYVGCWASGGGTTAVIGVFKHSGIPTPCPYLSLPRESGTAGYYWTDNSGNFRVSTANSHIGTTSGTVVGTQTSDERLKNILGPVEFGLGTINQIEPVRYTLKSEPDTERLGFIAQQVLPLVPQSVFDTKEHIEGEPEDAPTKLGMEYVALVPVLVNAIKELSAKNDALEARLAVLESA